MAVFKTKTVDSVLTSMSKLLTELDGVQKYNADALVKLDAERDRLQAEALAHATEASRAAKIRANFAKLLEA